MLLTTLTLLAAAPAAEEPTYQYISCIKSEVARLKKSDQSPETIADMAVANCEEFVGGAAQASVDETPPELMAAYEKAGVTSEMFFERQKQIARQAARDMALSLVEEETKDQSI